MSSDFFQSKLEALLNFSNGRSSPKRHINGKYPVFGANGIIGYANETNSGKNTIVIGRVGSYCGSVHFSKNPCWTTDNTIRATANEENDAYFLYCLLKSLNLNRMSSGSGQPLINQSVLNSITVTIPNPTKQKEISRLAQAIDDRITNLFETNTTLETIAQTLFRSWFSDFDPVRAKQEGRILEGMDEETAALFPDDFEESELGPIPQGWEYGTLNDLAILNPESWTAKSHPQDIAYVDLANVKENKIFEVFNYSFEDAPSRARRVLRSGDTIIGTVRPGNRSFAFIHQPIPNLTGSTGFAVLRPSAAINTEFVYLAATQSSSIEYLTHVADGGAYPAVRPDIVSCLPVVIPSKSILEAFHAIAEPLLAKISYNQKQAQTLAELRDTLLPRLISGQLRIPEAEELVGQSV